jgi:hypothetical protein
MLLYGEKVGKVELLDWKTQALTNEITCDISALAMEFVENGR